MPRGRGLEQHLEPSLRRHSADSPFRPELPTDALVVVLDVVLRTLAERSDPCWRNSPFSVERRTVIDVAPRLMRPQLSRR